MTRRSRSSVRGAFVPVPQALLNRIRFVQNVQQFFLGAGLRFTKEGETGLWIRSDRKADTFVDAVELQDDRGELLPDAQKRLDPDNFGFDRGADKLVQSQMERGLRTPSWMTQVQMDLLASRDPLGTLGETAREHDLSLWAIITSEVFRRRLLVFEILDYLRAGQDPSKFVERPRVLNPLVSGLVELRPASTLCCVLAARPQPLVAVLLTPFLTEVVLVPRRGSFVREASVQPWPVAFNRISLFGVDREAYRTPLTTLPSGHGQAALLSIVAGGNRLFRHVTRPETWCVDGGFDFDGRILVWSSIRFGLDAITALAADWTSHEAIWTAFRALTILQGLWDCHLSELLDPERLQRHVVPLLFDEAEQSWAGGILANYRDTFAEAFPGRSSGNVAVKLAEIRNLVHGARARDKDPMLRIDVLRSVERAGPSLELIRDVAALWWTAVLLSPETHCLPGLPPWRISKAMTKPGEEGSAPQATHTSVNGDD